MARIWVGDFRIKEIQRAAKELLKNQDDNKYFFDDTAEYHWFDTVAVNQFVAELTGKSSAVIMVGFNDCINSCVWPTFNIADTATSYADIINKLAKQHTGIDFYFCSVNPVEAGYPFSGYTDDLISSTDLNAIINEFNQAIKNKLTTKVKYLDTAEYLTTTSFNTRDGVRFALSTAEAIVNFITTQTGTSGGSSYRPRLIAPDYSSSSDNVIYWRGDSYRGYNPFDDLSKHVNEKYPGDTLPNCTAYAWGRFYEILDEQPKLSTDKVELWYSNSADGYKRGQEPALGAIMCWNGTSSANTDGKGGRGHVAIVEKINTDGSIVTSESGWNDSRYWWTTERVKGDDENWGQGSAYTFQGFIYCPSTTIISKEEIRSENNWSVFTVDDEMKKNAQYIWQYLGARGWTMNAVAGLLGNLQEESGMSPGIWEAIIDGSIINPDGTQELNKTAIDYYYYHPEIYRKDSNGNYDPNDLRYPGYGLVQWTPYDKYTNWCKNTSLNGTGSVLPYWDMDSQLQRIIWEADYDLKYPNKGQWRSRESKGYALSFSDFISSTKDAYWLAGAFAFCYERPWRSSSTAAIQNALKKERGEFGKNWYTFLNSLPPITSDVQLQVTNFKIDKCNSTNIAASFIIKNGKSGKYIVQDNFDNEVTNGTFAELSQGIKTFEIKTGIKPNCNYKLKLEILSADEKNYDNEIPFITPQDYPACVKDIELTCQDTIKAINSKFKLKVAKPEYLGYWKSDSGYELQLIVNSKIVKTKTIKEVKDISESFTIKEKFNYNCRIGDIIQIGIMVWTKDDTGECLYNNNSKIAKTSKPICLLNNPITAYLNID